MKMIKRLLLLCSILLFLITSILFGWYYYRYYSVMPTYQKKLTGMVQNRLDEINKHLNTQEKYALQLSQDQTVITQLQNGTSQKLSSIIHTHQENMEFKHIILINKNGKIVFSTTPKEITGINILEHTDSSLGKSYERATMTLTSDFSNFNFNTLLGEQAFFITIPILKEKKYIGALCYQLDEDKIYRITNQYIGLGKTGEVALGKKDGDYVTFLSPTRNDPDLAFKKRTLFTHPPLSIQAGTIGQEGSGTAIDYRGQKVVGSWKFIPKLDWGMIVKIDFDEIIEPTFIIYRLFLFFLFLFMVNSLINVYIFRHKIHSYLQTLYVSSVLKKLPVWCKNPLLVLFIIFSCLTTKEIIQCHLKKTRTIEKAKQKALEINTKNSEITTKLLERIAFTGQSIAQDLHTNYLKKDDLTTRIERDRSENNIITDITIAYVPYGHNDKTEFHVETTLLDKNHTNIFESKWYTKALEHNSNWVVNNPSSNISDTTATYSCAFFDEQNKPQGVIAITFALQTIIKALETSSVGKTGYSIITTEDGTFIFHPISTLVQEEITFLQFAQSLGNQELASIAQKMLDGKPLMEQYKSHTTSELYWIVTEPINTNKWTVSTIFSEHEVGLSAQKVRHYYFWILLWFIITLLFFVSFLYSSTYISNVVYDILINSLLLLGIILAWYTITITPLFDKESITIISDQSSLDKFLHDLYEDAQRKHEPKPITIPCGIILYSLNVPNPDHIEVSGYLWTKYNTKEHKNIAHGIDILQETRIFVGKPLSSTAGEWETETWTIQGTIAQEQQNALYPFDRQRLRIFLEHRDIEKNIILTPDLIGYKKASPESTPGLDREFSVSGFNVEQTFFEYKNTEPKTNFGFREYGKVTDHFHLIYNVILTRNLLNPFVLYILPLLVIIFSLFCTLLIASKRTDPFSMLAPYTGLFFSLIILQRSLREQHPSGSTLYFEYAFFYTYITIILLILHTILNHLYKHKIEYQDTIFRLMKMLFWPFQLVAWFITTLVIFY